MAIPAYNVPVLTAGINSQEQDCLLLRAPYKYLNTCKSIDGWEWNPIMKAWEYPANTRSYMNIVHALPNVQVAQEAKDLLAGMIEQRKDAPVEEEVIPENVQPIDTMPVVIKPFNHQVAGFNLGVAEPNVALLMEQGCGKTLTAIAISGYRYFKKQVQRVLIVAPASVVPVWPMEFKAYANFPHQVTVPEGTIKQRAATIDALPMTDEMQVVVINYEATWRMEESLHKFKPDMVIADESQRIKTPGARQSKCLHKLGKRTKYRLVLTGTPVSQSPLDFFSQYKFLDPTIFGNSYWAFKARYAILGGYENREIVGYKNLPELVKKAHAIAFRVTKAQALDLPEYTDQVLFCDLERDAHRKYAQMARESVAELSEETTVIATNVLSRLLRLSQLTGGFIKEDGKTFLTSTAKMDLLEEVMGDLMGDLMDAGKKVVVFVRFLPEIAAIRKMLLERLKVDYEWIAGEVKMEDRGEAVRRFQEDPECKVFLAQIQTAGLGITLTAADTAIFYSLDYSFANYDQCRARIHRLGQKNSCTYMHLVARNTVDEKVLLALKDKRNIADLVVDNWKDLFKEG